MVQAIDDAMPPAQTPEWFSVDAGSQFEETIETEQEVEDLNQSLPRDDAQETDGFPGFEFVNFDGVWIGVINRKLLEWKVSTYSNTYYSNKMYCFTFKIRPYRLEILSHLLWRPAGRSLGQRGSWSSPKQ